MGLKTRVGLAGAAAAVCVVGIGATSEAAYANQPAFVAGLHVITTVASTVPGNGDVNPYGVAVVPRSQGRLHGGDVLVSNFNNGANLQGTGTTIVQVSPSGVRTLFAHVDAARLPGPCPGGVGLTTALVALRS